MPLPGTHGDLNGFLATNLETSYISALFAPNMFRNLKVGMKWDWNKALRALDSLTLCPAISEYAEALTLDLFMGNFPQRKNGYEGVYKGVEPPSRLPGKLLEVPTSLHTLEKHIMVVPEHHTEVFRKTFQAANASFPSV